MSIMKECFYLEREILKNMLKDKSFGEILYEEEMKNHTSFRIGGPVDVMIIPTSEREIIDAISFLRVNKIDFITMGNGSNMLVRDGGIRGVVVKIAEGFKEMKVDGEKIYCEAGALLSKISSLALENSLKSFEFASGIPGTIGGAMAMNAGAYGGEMKDIVLKVRAIDKKGEVHEYTNEEMNFRYRNSRVLDEDLIVIGVELGLEKGNYQAIKDNIDDVTYKRTSKQPLEYPSGGSTFKRPEGYYAGKLIDDAGLRGLRYKGAMVSEKHCGFVINIEDAKCSDVIHLIDVVKKIVRDKFDVELEREIKLIGDE